MNKETNVCFLFFFSEIRRALKLMFFVVPGGSGGFREVREAYRNHFHLSCYLIVPGITSYDPEPWGAFFRSSLVLSA